MELVTALVVAIVVAGILALMVPGLRSRREGAGLSDALGPSKAGGLIAGFVGALGVSGAMNLSGAGIGTGLTIGVLYAVATVVAVRLSITAALILAAGGTVIGAASTGYAAIVLPGCGWTGPSDQVLAILVVVIFGLLGVAAAIFMGPRRWMGVVAALSAIKIVLFIASPFGVSFLHLPSTAWPVVLLAAIGLGIGALLAPAIVIGLAALAVSVTTLLTSAIAGTACVPGAHPEDLATITGYIVVALLLNGLIGRFSRR